MWIAIVVGPMALLAIAIYVARCCNTRNVPPESEVDVSYVEWPFRDMPWESVPHATNADGEWDHVDGR